MDFLWISGRFWFERKRLGWGMCGGIEKSWIYPTLTEMAHDEVMSNYRRPKITGSTVFFTVNLADRRSDLLVREIDSLREAVWVTRNERPFGIEAWVVVPDHLHCIWQLPDGDRDYGTRWGAIKTRFTRAVRDSGRVGFQPTTMPDGERSVVGWNPTLRSSSKLQKGDAGIW